MIMPTVVLGNTAPVEPVKPDETSLEVERIPRPDLGHTETGFNIPDDPHWDLAQILQTVSSVYRSHHSDEPPAWVESTDEDVAKALAKQFECPVGRPADWGKEKVSDG